MTFAVTRRQHQLGLDPATVATVAAITQSLINKHPKDKSRFQANEAAYKAAAQGFKQAVTFLKHRTGQYGEIAFIPAFPGFAGGGPVDGWATQAAKDHAAQLLTAALRVEIGMDPGLAPRPGEGIPRPPMAGDDYDDDYPGYIPGGGQPLPPVVTQASMSFGPLLVIGAVAAIVLSQRKGSR